MTLIVPLSSILEAKSTFVDNFAKKEKEAFDNVSRCLYTFAMSFEDRINPLAAAMTATNYMISNHDIVSRGTAEQVIAAFCEACSLGLLIDKVSANAYLVPYNKSIQLVLGYRFLLELAKRENASLSVVINYVTKAELPYFSVERKGEKFLVYHRELNARDSRDTDNIALLYAEVRQHNKLIAVQRMTRKEVDYYRSLSPSKNGDYSPWKLHFFAMWQAKLMRQALRLFVTMPVERAAKVDMTTNDLTVEYDDYEEIEQQEQEQMQQYDEMENAIFEIFDQNKFTAHMTELRKQFGAEKTKELPQPIIDAATKQFGIIGVLNKMSIDAERAAYIEKCKSERTKILIAEQMLKNQ